MPDLCLLDLVLDLTVITNDLYQAFAVFDRNKDGYVDAEELRFALCNYGEAMSQQEADEVTFMNSFC